LSTRDIAEEYTISKKLRINEQIKFVDKVLLIDAEGQKIGDVSIREAKEMAQEAGLDLVEIAPDSNPPVCRVMDYGKHRYEQTKKQAGAKTKQKKVKVKEIKFRPGTEEGDYQVKLRNLIRFLQSGDRVKVTLRFRGREMMHRDLAQQLFARLRNDAQEHGAVEMEPKLEGRQIIMIVVPKK